MGDALRIFVCGNGESVGKSTVCLGLVHLALHCGKFTSDEIAYIKPCTQCVAPQLITKFCHANKIACRGVGPVVFQRGFTRKFLDGEIEGGTEALRNSVKEAVDTIAKGKKFVVIDGVGHPAVGSIVGVSNAEAALDTNSVVLYVGRSGVGDAIDSMNRDLAYMEGKGCRVFGVLFNRIKTEGFYGLEKVKEYVLKFVQAQRSDLAPIGFVPEIVTLASVARACAFVPLGAVVEEKPEDLVLAEGEPEMCEAVGKMFKDHLDFELLLKAAGAAAAAR